MTTALMSLVGFAMWAVVLVTAIGAVRVWKVVTREAKPNGFPSGQPHGSDMYWRLNRAHMNALENLPIFAAVVLAGAMLEVRAPLFSTLASVVLGARVLQSVFHISSGRSLVVNLRFTAFLAQLVCMAWMALLIASR